MARRGSSVAGRLNFFTLRQIWSTSSAVRSIGMSSMIASVCSRLRSAKSPLIIPHFLILKVSINHIWLNTVEFFRKVKKKTTAIIE